MPDESLLLLTGIGLPPYAARGLTQSLDPIEAAGSQRRTVNGTLVDLSQTLFRKYRSTIRGRDQQAPALDGVWPGRVVNVSCIAELCCPVTASPERPVVIGSQRLEGSFMFYRPQLTMQVVGLTMEKDEYGAATSWTLELEEI